MSDTIYEFLTSGRVLITMMNGPYPLEGHITAIASSGFIFHAFKSDSPPIFISWSAVARITQVEKSDHG